MPVTGSKTASRIAVADEQFSPASGRGCALFVNIGCDGFFFTALDLSENKFVLFQSYPFSDVFSLGVAEARVRELAQENEILSSTPFKSVFVSAVHPVSTLVPAALFEESEKEKYFRLNHTLKADDKIFTDTIHAAGAVNLYALPASLEKTIYELFPSASFSHFSTALVEGALHQYASANEKKAIVHAGANHFEIIIVQGKSLLFYNTFRMQTTEDFIYHILFSFEQLGIDPSASELVLTGEVDKNSALYETAYKYIRDVNFGSRPDAFHYCAGLNTLPLHAHYNLFCQALCV